MVRIWLVVPPRGARLLGAVLVQRHTPSLVASVVNVGVHIRYIRYNLNLVQVPGLYSDDGLLPRFIVLVPKTASRSTKADTRKK
ncbi:hypothetical protein E2C01_072242 [Portunus trituberculatus]|uniref:Uncharacterized protein n=1 Tax=Portunus trituberculatus TaxID=210409 RepID=A0A5B7I8E8_PORTR|nr:hypothetical protein [Portunus trituberculatus]